MSYWAHSGIMNCHDAPAFDVYGFRFKLLGSCPWAIDSISEDFAFFRTVPSARELPVEVLEGDPDYGGLPNCDASIYTPRNTVYQHGSNAYVDYHGKGLGVHDLSGGGFRIISRDPQLLYEASYLFLLSQISQSLDTKRLHRIHALGISMKGRAILALLPMGGGKSTLAAHLLPHPDVKLMSDDSPYVDAKGRIHAFPLHLGLLDGVESDVPEQYLRRIHRMEFGPKTLVNYSYFADRVCPSADPGIVFLGSRTLSQDCRIEPAGMPAAVRAMIANSVVGLGLFQGLEFILQRSAWELLKKSRVARSRLANCLRLLRRSQVYRLHLGRNPELNAATVVNFAQKVLF